MDMLSVHSYGFWLAFDLNMVLTLIVMGVLTMFEKSFKCKSKSFYVHLTKS